MARRRKRLRIGRILIALFLITSIIAGGLFTLNTVFKKNNTNAPSNNNASKKPSNDKDQKEDKEYKLSLLATGDGLIHNAIYLSYELPGNTYDFKDAVSEVKDIVSKYDIAYYNQETPIAKDNSTVSGYPMFNTPHEYADAMQDIGFNMVSLASNHSLDRNELGITNSVNYWKTTDTLFHGMATSEEEQNNSIIIKEKNNITYTMLSYTEMTNGIPIPNGKDYLVNVYSKEKVKKDIESIRDKVDVLIVAMHWGVEYTHTPNEKQKEMAAYLASLGVDIIIGNHPHVLQPITWIDDTLVIYSLGNFISNQYSTGDYSKRIGFLATMDITKTVKGNDTSIKIDNLGGELIFTHYKTLSKEPNNRYHKVIPFSKMTDGTYVKDYQRLHTKYSQILENMGTKLNIAPLPN